MKYLFLPLLAFLCSLTSGYCELTDEQTRCGFMTTHDDTVNVNPGIRENRKDVYLSNGSCIAVSSAEGNAKENKIFPISGKFITETSDDRSTMYTDLSRSSTASISDQDEHTIEIDGDISMGGGIRTYGEYWLWKSPARQISFPKEKQILGIVGNGASYAARLSDGTLFAWGDPDRYPSSGDTPWKGSYLKPEGKKVASIVYFDLTELVALCDDGSLCFWNIDENKSWHYGIIPLQTETQGRKIVAIDSWQPSGWNYGIDELMFGLHITFDNGVTEDWYDNRDFITCVGWDNQYYLGVSHHTHGHGNWKNNWKQGTPKPFTLLHKIGASY